MSNRGVAVLMVSLCDVEPKIWRRFSVPASIRLDELHWAIQAVMGWEGAREFAFEIGGRRYEGKPGVGDSRSVSVEGASKATLAKVKPKRGDVFRYVCVQEEPREHDVVLEALDWDESDTFTCTGGAIGCPGEGDTRGFSASEATRVLRLMASAGVLGDYE